MALGFPHYPTIQWFIMLFFHIFPCKWQFSSFKWSLWVLHFEKIPMGPPFWEKSKLHAAQGAWDFSDEEEFSDDEEKVRFDKGRPLVMEPKQ